MRDDHVEVRMALEDAHHAIDTGAGDVFPRYRPRVYEQKRTARRHLVVDGCEARIVGVHALDVLVQFEPAAAVIECGPYIGRGIGIVRMHRRERDAEATEVARRRREPRVELARHPGLVRVTEEHESFDTRIAQSGRDVVRLRGMPGDIPITILRKPPPNCGKQFRRM
jgi:hypothetical protein